MDNNTHMRLYSPVFIENNKQMKLYYPVCKEKKTKQMNIYFPGCIDNSKINGAVFPCVHGK